jgi:hypothetical protein
MSAGFPWILQLSSIVFQYPVGVCRDGPAGGVRLQVDWT